MLSVFILHSSSVVVKSLDSQHFFKAGDDAVGRKSEA